MSETTPKGPSGNPKIVGAAGFGLFLLGLASVALVYARGQADFETMKLVLGAAVLLSLGSWGLAVAGIQRLEARVAELERKK